MSAGAEEGLRVIRNNPTTGRNSAQLFLGPLGLSLVTGPWHKKGSNVSPRSGAKHGTIPKTLGRNNTKIPIHWAGENPPRAGKNPARAGENPAREMSRFPRKWFPLLAGGSNKSSAVPRPHLQCPGQELGAQGAGAPSLCHGIARQGPCLAQGTHPGSLQSWEWGVSRARAAPAADLGGFGAPAAATGDGADP